jgi:hypothetical protein
LLDVVYPGDHSPAHPKLYPNRLLQEERKCM